MDGLDGIDLLPEPTDRRILSAIDPSTSGYHDEWRAEVTGWAPHYAEPIARMRRKRFTASNITIFAILSVILLLVWQSGLLFIELPPPKYVNYKSKVLTDKVLEFVWSIQVFLQYIRHLRVLR